MRGNTASKPVGGIGQKVMSMVTVACHINPAKVLAARGEVERQGVIQRAQRRFFMPASSHGLPRSENVAVLPPAEVPTSRRPHPPHAHVHAGCAVCAGVRGSGGCAGQQCGVQRGGNGRRRCGRQRWQLKMSPVHACVQAVSSISACRPPRLGSPPFGTEWQTRG